MFLWLEMISTEVVTHKLNAWGRNTRNMEYCYTLLVMPGISGTRKIPNQAHGYIPAFLLPLKSWVWMREWAKEKIKSQGILAPGCFTAEWFVGRTIPGIAPVLFAGRQTRHLLNSSFFLHLLEEITKNSQGCQLHFSHGFCLKHSPGCRGVCSQGSPSGSLDCTKLWEHSPPKWYRHMGQPAQEEIRHWVLTKAQQD